MTFFQGASHVKITGGSFNVVHGNYTHWDQSRHHTNVGSFNNSSTTTWGSHNDNSSRYHGANADLLSPPTRERDRPRSAGIPGYGNAAPPVLPPPSVHPALMEPQYPQYLPPGSQIHNSDVFNTTTERVDSAFNDYSQQYGASPSTTNRRKKKKQPTVYYSDDEEIAQETVEGGPTRGDRGNPNTRGDQGDPRTRGDPRFAAQSIPRGPSWKNGHPHPTSPSGPRMGHRPYSSPYGPGGTNGVSDVLGNGLIERMSPEMLASFQQIMEMVKKETTMSDDEDDILAGSQQQPSEEEEGEEEASEEDGDSHSERRPKVPKAPRDRLTKGMADMTLDDEASRPDFSRVKSDPQKPLPTAPSGTTPPRAEPRHSNTTREIPRQVPSMNPFDASASYPWAPGTQAGFTSGSQVFSPSGPPVPSGPPPWNHQGGVTTIDQSFHHTNIASGNTHNKITQDSYNDNSLKTFAPAEVKKGPKKQGPVRTS